MSSTSTTHLTPLQQAQDELAEAAMPIPADFIETLSPHAAGLWCWEAAKSLMVVLAAASASLMADNDEEQPTINEVLNGAAASLAGLTHSLVALGVLPPEAEAAIAQAPDAVA